MADQTKSEGEKKTRKKRRTTAPNRRLGQAMQWAREAAGYSSEGGGVEFAVKNFLDSVNAKVGPSTWRAMERGVDLPHYTTTFKEVERICDWEEGTCNGLIKNKIQPEDLFDLEEEGEESETLPEPSLAEQFDKLEAEIDEQVTDPSIRNMFTDEFSFGQTMDKCFGLVDPQWSARVSWQIANKYGRKFPGQK